MPQGQEMCANRNSIHIVKYRGCSKSIKKRASNYERAKATKPKTQACKRNSMVEIKKQFQLSPEQQIIAPGCSQFFKDGRSQTQVQRGALERNHRPGCESKKRYSSNSSPKLGPEHSWMISPWQCFWIWSRIFPVWPDRSRHERRTTLSQNSRSSETNPHIHPLEHRLPGS